MGRVLDIISKVIKWINLIVIVIPHLESMYENMLAIYAVIKTESDQINSKASLVTGLEKKNHARNILQKSAVFKGKNEVVLNKIVDSAWNYVFHKEK